jgi:hypothetical protein
MAYFKWGFIAAVVSFIVSFGIGLIFGVGVFHIILRAFIFAFVSFGVGFGLRFVVYSFFPELLTFHDEYSGPETHEQQPGSRVNITLDTEGKYALPELYKTPGDTDKLGNIEDLVSGYFRPSSEGIDRNREERYNQEEENDDEDGFPDIPEAEDLSFEDTPVFEKPRVDKPVFNPSFEDSSGGLGGLPDLDAMAMVFSPAGESSGESSSEAFTAWEPQSGVDDFDSFDNVEPKKSSYAGNKSQPLKGDFDPKELAKGISTVLTKEK